MEALGRVNLLVCAMKVLSTRGCSAPIPWGEQHEDDDHDSKEDAFFALAALHLMKLKLKLEHVEC